MYLANRLFAAQTFLLITLIGHGFGQDDKSVAGLNDFLDNLPNQPYVQEDALLLNSQNMGMNSVRYTVTINVDHNKCALSRADNCSGEKMCKIFILEKPWGKRPDGSKFREVLANNCTKDWPFVDNGEVLASAGDKKRGNDHIHSISNSAKPVLGLDRDIFKVIYETGTPEKQPTKRTLLEYDFNLLQAQIIPDNEYPTKESVIDVIAEKNISTKKENTALKEDFVQTSTDVDDTKTLLSEPIKKNMYMPSEKEHSPRIRSINNEALKVLEMAQRFKYLNDLRLGEYLGKLDPVLQILANDIIKKIENESNNPNAINLRVLEASTRKSSGIVKQMLIESVFTNCNKSVPFSLRNNCTALDYAGSHLCEVIIIDLSWLDDKQITYTCIKRDIVESISPVGGKILTGNTKNPKILAMAQLALQHLEKHSNVEFQQKIVNVTKVSTQFFTDLLTSLEFVAGYTTCLHAGPEDNPENCKLLDMPLRHCKAQIRDHLWLARGKEVKVTCDDSFKLVTDLNNNEISRRKREIDVEIVRDTSHPIGGFQNMDPKDPKYKVLAQESLKKYIKESKLPGKWKISQVTKVMYQMVAGANINIDFNIVSKRGFRMFCHSNVFEQPWTNTKTIYVTCKRHTKKSKHTVLGGTAREEDPNKKMYKNLAKEAMSKYLESRSGASAHVTKVLHVTTLIEEGPEKKTKIGFMGLGDDSAILVCDAIVIDRPRLDSREINVNCV